MVHRRSIFLVVFALTILALSFGVSFAQEATPDAPSSPGAILDVSGDWTIATVVKLTGIAWFDRMETGVNWVSEDYPNVTAFQQGPAQADAALQVQVIEDLLAQGVDALCVIPFQPETVEPVLQRAREEGVVVITHEASNQENIDYDIEAFDNSAYGVHLMEALAERMNYEGEYTVFVGSLTSATHNQWVDAAIAYQQENYPDMTFVGDKNESFDDPQQAYERMQELLIAYPNLRGVQGSASTDVVGVGQAVEEAGLQDQIVVVGTSLPSISRDLINTDAIDLISFWDPALAGYACNMLAIQQLEGTLPVTDGELPEEGFGFSNLTGYEELSLVDKVFYGAAWVDVTSENVDEWDF
ncbi:MAG: autoinducer 2 ABC transporter substrate-binding protein [Anaerolineae bacterium]|nr:autoinducer 2 ABC transporter substrate-binding protein [Anaerolineae bacterium]